MKFHEIAEDLLASRIKLKLVKTLIKFPAKRFSGRELARLLGVSPVSTLTALESLRRAGLARKATIGKTTEWGLNPGHILVKYFRPLADLDAALLEALFIRVKKALAREKYIVKVTLFGSIARGAERPESDIDLFIIVNEQKNKVAAAALIDKLNESVISDFGNLISPVIYSRQELRGKQKLDLLSRIREEGKIIINNE